MMEIVSLIAVAFVLIFLEVILPGGVLGLVGLVCLGIASWIAGEQYGLGVGVVVFATALFVVLLLVYFSLKHLAVRKKGRGLILHSAITGDPKDNLVDGDLLGQKGETLTPLNPSGKVAISGQTFEASARDGYIEAGASIEVVIQDTFKITVKKI